MRLPSLVYYHHRLIYQLRRTSRSEFAILCALSEFRITRFQFARDRVIGDSQVRADDVNIAALELIADTGAVGLGFIQTLFHPLPDQAEIERVFRSEVWPGLEGSRRRRWCIASAGRAVATSGPTRCRSMRRCRWRCGISPPRK